MGGMQGRHHNGARRCSPQNERVAPGTVVGKVSMTSDRALAVGTHWGQALYTSCMLARAAKCRATMRQNSLRFFYFFNLYLGE